MAQWIHSAVEWARNIFQQAGIGPIAVLFAFLLGFLSAIASACCTLPMFGAIVGYSGTRKDQGRKLIFQTALFFMLGAIIATIILGLMAGSVSELAQTALGRYWKLLAGMFMIIIGLTTLKLLPIKLPHFKSIKANSEPKGLLGAAMFGLIVGGAMVLCTMPCNPAIFIVLTVAFIEGFTVWSIALLAAYAAGFSLPLAALMFGVSFGKATVKAQKAEAAIRIIAGIILIAAGFYFLKTL